MSKPKISGMHLVFNDRFIKVKRKKIKSENITPKPQIRYGVPQEDGSIKLVKSASIPVFRESVADRILAVAGEVETPPWEILFKNPLSAPMQKALGILGKLEQVPLLGDAVTLLRGALDKSEDYDEDAAKGKFKLFVEAILTGAQDLPLQSYKRTYIDVDGNIVAKPTRYQVKSVDDESGREQLEEFPYLESTKLFPINDSTTQPRIWWDELLRQGDMVYEVFATDDVGRFALWELANKMNAWEYGEGHPLHGKGPQEVMAVIEGVHMTSGTTQEYITLIASKRIIQADGSEKFVLVMKNCQSNIAYANAMNAPKPGETPVTVAAEAKPLIMATFADLIQKVKA